jgi:hypothetical protein
MKGLIIPLRRGIYAFPDNLAKNPLTAERAANQIQKESYITGLWCLNQLGLTPEGVTAVTSATRNNPAEFETPIGRFTYSHIQPQGFFGFETKHDSGGIEIRIATPEKALLDFFWWRGGNWNENEFARWRIQDPLKKINHKRLKEFAKRWNQPRLIRAAKNVTIYLQGLGAKAPTPYSPQRSMLTHAIIDQRIKHLVGACIEKIEAHPHLLDGARKAVENWPSSPRKSEWANLLLLPIATLKENVLGMDEDATRLRQSAPFGGILDTQERIHILNLYKV